MDQDTAVERLNDLLVVEGQGLLGRLHELHPFIDLSDAAAAGVLRQVADRQQEHLRALAETILRLDGVPRPRQPDMSTARVHYLSLRYLLPYLVGDLRRRIDAYGRAATELAGQPLAAETVGRILAEHQADLERLEALAQSSAPAEQAVAATAGSHDA